MRWEKYGWQLSRITNIFTNATPCVFKKFNYRIIWADGRKGPAKLSVEVWPGVRCLLQLMDNLIALNPGGVSVSGVGPVR